MEAKKNSKKGIIIGVVILAVILCVLGVVYVKNRPQAQAGAKAYTLVVVDNESKEKTYTGRTDAEYLRGIMDELQAAGDFSYGGSESEYGLMIDTINGLTADYDTDGAYWSIYVNGEYGNYGADQQVVADGDTFTFKYEVYQE